MHLSIFLPVHGTPSIVGTPPGEVSPVAAAASSTVDLASRPSGLATEAPGLVAVATAPSQFRLNSTVSVTCAKSSPWMIGAGCELSHSRRSARDARHRSGVGPTADVGG